MRIAVAVFEGAEELDFVGPWEVLAAWRFLYPDDVEVVTVGETVAPMTCAKGMRVVPETSWDELGEVDVLVYPGGRGTRPSEHGRTGMLDRRSATAAAVQSDRSTRVGDSHARGTTRGP